MSDNGSGLTTEEQATLDEMRSADAVPDSGSSDAPVEITGGTEGAAEPTGEDGAAAPSTERQRLVPHAALHEERERRKALERQSAETQRQWEERFNALLQRFPQSQQGQQQGQAPAPPPLPDPEKDPVGYLVERQNRAEHAMQQMAQILLAERQQNAQAQQQAQVVDVVRNRAQVMESQFAATNPDYPDAANYLADQRHKELAEAGWTDPAERQEMIRNEALGLAYRAQQQGRNPAEIVYNMAKMRGYRPKSAKNDPAEKLAQVAAGQEQSRTLGNARGAAAPGFNAQSVMNMSQKEFDAFLKKASPEQMASVFGS